MLSASEYLCTRSHSSAHYTPDFVASASRAVVAGDGVVTARFGSHRRTNMALYWFRMSERWALVPEPSVPVNAPVMRCSIEIGVGTRRQERGK